LGIGLEDVGKQNIIYLPVAMRMMNDNSSGREQVRGRFFVERSLVERGFKERLSAWTEQPRSERLRGDSLHGETLRGERIPREKPRLAQKMNIFSTQ
jgi:hypothetical protein